MSNSIRANQLEERELFLLANNVPYDDRANLSANIADMKSSLLSEFLYTVGSDLYEASLKRPVEELAADMKLIGGPSELRKPLNVGLMFFNERPDNFFPYARIEVVDKPDPTGVGMTEKVFIGPLDKQLKDALSYIKNYIIKEKVIKIPGQAEAERIFNIPYAAVEEALSNAVYHKSYQIGEPITVTMTPEKMEITSLPGPDPQLQMKISVTNALFPGVTEIFLLIRCAAKIRNYAWSKSNNKKPLWFKICKGFLLLPQQNMP